MIKSDVINDEVLLQKEKKLVLELVRQEKELIKLVRFKVPFSNSKEEQKFVYIAQFIDSVEIFSVSTDEKKVSIKAQNIGEIDNHIIFTNATLEYIEKCCYDTIENKVFDMLSEAQLSLILSNYQKSSEYVPQTERDKLEDAAIRWYSKNYLLQLNSRTKYIMIKEIIKRSEFYIPFYYQGEIKIYLLYKRIAILLNDRELLVDRSKNALYNSLYFEFHKNANITHNAPSFFS